MKGTTKGCTMKKPASVNVGRRHSKATALGGKRSPVLRIDADAFHLLQPAALQQWAADALRREGVPVDQLLAAADPTVLNRGSAVRVWVASRHGEALDSDAWIAARVLELAILVDQIRTDPAAREWADARGETMRAPYELGRLSMLAKVYAFDAEAVRKRTTGAKAENTKYTQDQRDEWQRLRVERYADHTQRRAAALIAAHCGLPDNAAEAIRRELMKKSGNA